MPNPVVVLPVLDCALARRTISTLRDDERLGSLLVIDNSAEGLALDWDVWQLERPGVNLGVARSWNLGARLVLDDPARTHLVVLSQAVTFLDGGEALFALLDEHPVGFWSQFSWHVAAVGADVLRDVGLFDEQFEPAYFEDTDYMRRLDVAGLAFPKLDVGGVLDAGFALSLTSGLVEVEFGPLADRYRRKWGGDPGHERFERPYSRRR